MDQLRKRNNSVSFSNFMLICTYSIFFFFEKKKKIITCFALEQFCIWLRSRKRLSAAGEVEGLDKVGEKWTCILLATE